MNETKHKNAKYEAVITSCISLLTVTGIMLIFYFVFGIYYETNDDRTITEFLSGVLTGAPDGNTIYNNYLLGKVLALFFTVTKAIPWYGLFLFISHIASYFVILYGLLLQCKTLKSKCLGCLAGIVLILCNMPSVLQMQYTSTAGFLAVAGYVWLIADEDSKWRKYVVFTVFEFISLQLRTQSMALVQPIGLLFVASYYILPLVSGEKEWKQYFKRVLFPVGMIAVAMVLTFLTNVYPGKQYTEAWKTYKDFNEARTKIFDYSYISDEEALQPILEKYGVEQEELAAFRQYWMLGNPIPTECLEEIYESVKPVEEEAFFTPDLLKSLLRYRFSGENFHLGRCAFLGYVLVTMAIVFSGKWKFLIPLGAVNVGRLGLLLYLMYHARLPFRVISILYFAELAFMMLLAFLIFREVEWKKWKQALVILYLLGSVLVYTKFFYSNQLYLAEKNRVAEIACEGLVEIYDYCDMHPGKYVVENAACTWYVSDIFDTRVYHSRNLLVAGGWYSFSPEIVAYEKKYLAQDGETYIVFRTNVDEVKEHYVYKYLVNAKGCELIWRDHIDIITGDRLEVYQLIGEYPYEDR